MMNTNDLFCSICSQPYPREQWHDCQGVYDEYRFIVHGKLPRSARRRLSKLYNCGTDDASIREAITSNK